MTPEREKQIREECTGVNIKITWDAYPDYWPVVKELLAEIDALRQHIRIYGGHCGGCPHDAPSGDRIKTPIISCTCGFTVAYLKAEPYANI